MPNQNHNSVLPTLFHFVESFLRRENFICYHIFRILVSHRVQTHCLIAKCVVERMSHPLGYSVVRPTCIYEHIYFHDTMFTITKNKRLIILMQKNTCV